jgi:hypothetical protein
MKYICIADDLVGFSDLGFHRSIDDRQQNIKDLIIIYLFDFQINDFHLCITIE